MRRGSKTARQRLAKAAAVLAVACTFVPFSALGPACAAPGAVLQPKRYQIALKAPGQDEVALYAEEHGRGRPLLLLHGLGASSYTWRNLIPSLAQRHRVIALDLKGFGQSEKPLDLAYSLRDHAALVTAFIRKRGLKNVTIIGHSFGGAIALLTTLEFNRREPGRIRDLVLISAPAYNQPSTEFINFMRMPVLPYAAMTLVPPELALWLSMDDGSAWKLTADDIRAYAEPFHDPAAGHALITTARQIVPEDVDRVTARYPSIKQHTLIISCDGDTMVPLSTGQHLARAMPNARLEVMKGCGHAPQHDRPREVWRLIRRFLD